MCVRMCVCVTQRGGGECVFVCVCACTHMCVLVLSQMYCFNKQQVSCIFKTKIFLASPLSLSLSLSLSLLSPTPSLFNAKRGGGREREWTRGDPWTFCGTSKEERGFKAPTGFSLLTLPRFTFFRQHSFVVCAVLKKPQHLPSPHSSASAVLTSYRTRDCLLVGCLTSQQHASVSLGRICSDKFTCCHTEIDVSDQTFHLTQSQYIDTGPTSPSTNPITPGAWQSIHWSANV